MIADTITQKIAEAMKAKDEIRLSTLRMLSSALNYEKIAKQHELSEEEELAIVKKEVKKRQDAIEIYEKANAIDRADKEKKELAILKEYLPEELGDEQLVKIVEDAIKELNATAVSDMGKVIGKVMAEAKGAADGKRVSELVKSKLLNK